MSQRSILEAVSDWFTPSKPEIVRVARPPYLPKVGNILRERYRLEAEVGRGAAAVVFSATDLLLEATVAVKVANPDGIGAGLKAHQDGVDLRHEARLASRLSHPNIATVHHYDTEGRLEFLVMELVAGVNLSVLRRSKGQLGTLETARIGMDILAALEHIHGHRLVHNDVKPANIITDGRDSKLVDFGAAMELDQLPRVLAGSVAYMAPERLLNQPGEPRSDLYSLACTLYTLASGAPPFGRSDAAAMRGHLRETPQRLDGPLGKVLAIALAKEPEDRFPDAATMRGALAWAEASSADAPTVDRLCA